MKSENENYGIVYDVGYVFYVWVLRTFIIVIIVVVTVMFPTVTVTIIDAVIIVV